VEVWTAGWEVALGSLVWYELWRLVTLPVVEGFGAL